MQADKQLPPSDFYAKHKDHRLAKSKCKLEIDGLGRCSGLKCEQMQKAVIVCF